MTLCSQRQRLQKGLVGVAWLKFKFTCQSLPSRLWRGIRRGQAKEAAGVSDSSQTLVHLNPKDFLGPGCRRNLLDKMTGFTGVWAQTVSMETSGQWLSKR